MTEEVLARIGHLEHMTPAGLREVYREVFGEPSRSNNRRWLSRRIAWRLQAQAEGGLTERAKRRAEELARDADVRSRPRGARARRTSTSAPTTRPTCGRSRRSAPRIWST